MGKKATVNGFTEGLSMDLNVLTDTKETLIDALNATLVTGNGNEMILQNDDGNFELRIDEKKVVEFPLPYMIPVGIKEYGGIFYICVYDCTDNHLDGIYTYPSQMLTDRRNSFVDLNMAQDNMQLNYHMYESPLYQQQEQQKVSHFEHNQLIALVQSLDDKHYTYHLV